MIFVGNTLLFNLEQRDKTTGEFSSIASVEIIRKEFNAEEFEGVGYQRTSIADNAGEILNYGLGFNGLTTALQVSTNSFILPLYRFDFGFILDDFRLKQLYEIFLLSYSLRSNGEFVRIRMTDNRLYLSEPFDADLTILRTGTVQEIDNPLQYQLKTVDFLISWENFEWEFFVGNLYKVNVFGLEVEIESDSNQGTACFNSTEEIILVPNEVIGDGGNPSGQPTEGFELTELELPAFLLSSTATTSFGVGFKINDSPPNTYIGHFEKVQTGLGGGPKHVLIEWNEAAPGTFGETFVNYTNDFNFRYRGDSTPINTRVLSDKIAFIDRDPESTTQFFRSFSPDEPGVVSDNKETSQLPLVFYMVATNVNKFGFFLDEEEANGNLFLTPRDIRTTELTSSSNPGGIQQHFELGTNFGSNPYRPSLGYFGANENNRRIFLVGDSPQIGGSNVVIPALPTTPDEIAIRLTSNTANHASGFWYAEKLNTFPTMTLESKFELRFVPNDPGADGIAFVIHDDSRGVTALGLDGGRLGYAGNLLSGGFDSTAAISPSLAIEFDTFRNDSILDEPSGGTGVSYIRVVDGGDKTGATKLYEQALTMNLEGSAKLITVEFIGATNQIFFTIEDTAAVDPTENYTANGINLHSRIGTGEAYMGFTAGTGSLTNKHTVDRWEVAHNSTWKIELENTDEYRAELYSFDKSTNRIVDTRRTFMGREDDPIFSNVVTIKAQNEGSNIYYHICYTPGSPNIAKVYKTNGPNVFQPSKLLINSVTDGSIPEVDFGIDSPLGTVKFYLTQGSDSGNVYTTTDFINYTLLGSWDQEDAARENEGQIYKFRNTYLVRSPSRFVLDCFNDVFVDMRELTLASEFGSPEDTALFGPARKLVCCWATPRYDSDYVDNNEEKLVVCSNNVSNDQDLQCFDLKVV